MSDPPLILVVDDDQRNREMLAEALSQAGFAVDMACDGLEALRKPRPMREGTILC